MENPKYEINYNDTIIRNGKTLYGIRSLKNFGNINIGDLGGYIEKENNLSQYGNCWIYPDCYVYDDAFIEDNAVVMRNSEVFGNAVVRSDSIVIENSKIYDNAYITGKSFIENSKVYGNTNLLGSPVVSDNSEVFGNVKLKRHCIITNNSKIYDNAVISNDAYVKNAEVFGNVNIGGKVIILDNSKICGTTNTISNVVFSEDAYIRNNNEFLFISPINKSDITFYKTKYKDVIKVFDNNLFDDKINSVGFNIKEYKKIISKKYKDNKELKDLYNMCIIMALIKFGKKDFDYITNKLFEIKEIKNKFLQSFRSHISEYDFYHEEEL